jgi:hypothetical protein
MKEIEISDLGFRIKIYIAKTKVTTIVVISENNGISIIF